MKLARYVGNGQIAILDEPVPACPPGGLLVKTEASGLCSGELMDWYMEKKVPHVLGHEVAGIVVESQDERFPVGSRVFPHHHAPCLRCDLCLRGLQVHCEQWKRTKLLPGGMAEFFGVAAENLNDTHVVDDLRAVDAALIEPLACVMKSLRAAGLEASGGGAFIGETPMLRHTCSSSPEVGACGGRCSVIGLGVMGLMHMAMAPGAIGYEISEGRRAHARSLDFDARKPADSAMSDVIFVCPGSKEALDFAVSIANPGATIVLFAPMPPEGETPVDLNRLYFRDVRLVTAYSCGPDDTREAITAIRGGRLKAEQVVSDFIGIDELPEAYLKMKRGEILKPMVVF